MKSKSIYSENQINNTIMLVVFAALMLGFSLYLTDHFFKVKYPSGLEAGSLCNINSFFNCDKTTHSSWSTIFQVPISLFGAIIGVLTLLGLIFKSEEYEKTIYFVLIVNFVGCVLLFFYSLFYLKGLCPFCTLYYIASGLTLFLFYKQSESYKPNLGFLASFGLVFVLSGLLMRSNIVDRESKTNAISNDLIKQYYSLPNLGMPQFPSIYKLAHMPNAPIKIAIFSDFECPACRALSEQMETIITKYAGKIDIQYYFYPLDNQCNPNMQNALHTNACKAAYISTCMPSNDFLQVHNTIFKNQDNIRDGFLDEFIKANRLEKCVTDPASKEKVLALINAANPFNIRSTPTYLINGVKIEGVLPIDQLSVILDEIIKRSN